MSKLKEGFSIKDSTGYWLLQTYNAISESLQDRLDEYDVTVAQWPVLYSLYKDSINAPAELAEYLGLNRSAITRLLDRLEKKKLIKRTGSSHDKRSVEVSLTKRGHKIVPQLAQISRETNNQFLAGLSKKEIQLFDEILKKIHSNKGKEK